MRRFFLPAHALSGDQITLIGSEAHHISSVLRLRPGQTVELFSGGDAIHTAVLETVDKKLVSATITTTRLVSTATTSPLTLAQCLLKGKKMDMLIQKATELGVQVFLPLVSRYCENHGNRNHQEERWQRIMLEACKQCHRPTPMTIVPVTPLAQADFSSFVHRLTAWEEERQAHLVPTFGEHPGAICLLVGPEGGLHSDDLAALAQWNFTPFSLGPRILRAETAALAATAIVQYLAGALRPPIETELP